MINYKNDPEIYFHVGMGKAASTFLQYSIFPEFKGVHYIQRTRYKRAPKIISAGKHKKYLLSGELDNRLFENYVSDFSAKFPETKTFIVLRRHDSWIASQYRRYLKNGYALNFKEFFDLSCDSGFWKQKDLYFFPLIQILEKYFRYKPLVLFYEDLRNNPEEFIRRIGDYTGAVYDIRQFDLTRRHSSYNEKQLKAIMAVSKRIDIRRKRTLKNKTIRVIIGLIPNLIRYSVLYLAPLLPDSLFRKEELIPPGTLSEIRQKYTPDWDQCIAYANSNNPPLP
jgi:hypothetical protein